MADQIRIKRSTGSAAPSTLLNAELSYSEGGDGTLYIGVGTGGANGTATQVVQIGGAGVASAVVSQRAAGSIFAGPASGANAVPTWRGLVSTDIPDLSSSYLTLNAASATYAPLSSPNLTGVPLAPTAANGTATNQVATTQFVVTAIDNVVGANVSAALDTLRELGDALGSDANFAGTVTTALNARLVGTNNLNDVANITLARGNLGLGDLAVQNSSNVTITGGSIDSVSLNNVTLDGGSY